MLERQAGRPTVHELSARIEARGRVEPGVPSERLVREIRDRGE